MKQTKQCGPEALEIYEALAILGSLRNAMLQQKPRIKFYMELKSKTKVSITAIVHLSYEELEYTVLKNQWIQVLRNIKFVMI